MKPNATPRAERTLRNEQRDFTQWHRGRGHYALWALLPDCVALEQRVQAAQARLSKWLLEGYRRQPHITLGLCGFPSTCATQDDDFEATVLRRQLDALRELRPAPFGITVGGLDSFSSVPYLAVQAQAADLGSLRQCLATNAAINTPPDRYTPHVTVGLYAGAWPLSTLHAAFDRFTVNAPLHLEISAIQLLSYAAAEIGGPLQLLANYDFASGSLRWEDSTVGLPASFRDLA